MIRADNARLHGATMTEQFLEQNAMKRVLYRASSRDLAQPAFDLFCNVKQLLVGQEFPDGEALLRRINAILGGIEKVILENVSLEWLERLRRCVNTDGEYVDELNSLRQWNCIIYGQSRDAHGRVGHPILSFKSRLSNTSILKTETSVDSKSIQLSFFNSNRFLSCDDFEHFRNNRSKFSFPNTLKYIKMGHPIVTGRN
jgi:hypothetical protein